MYNLINTSNGNYIGMMNGEMYEMDMLNFRYDLEDNSNNSKFLGLEHSLVSALKIFFTKLDLKIKIQYSGGRLTLKGFIEELSRRILLRQINFIGADKYFDKYSNIPYKYGGQGKFVFDIQVFMAYNLGKQPSVRISEKTFIKMVGTNYENYILRSKRSSSAQVFGANVLIEKENYDGYYISKSE